MALDIIQDRLSGRRIEIKGFVEEVLQLQQCKGGNDEATS